MKRIVFTVTNDLSFDQRMHRICTSLSKAGFDVLLVGRKLNASRTLKAKLFQQKRLSCFFTEGFLFYAEYNLRLFFFLLFIKMDAVCAIDLDTILPCYYISVLRSKKRIYDAHELFTEMKEIISRPVVKKIWNEIEQFAVSKFKYGYTVSYSIAQEFNKRYSVNYEVIRNVPNKKNFNFSATGNTKNILYQGAVNEARGLEELVLAMKNIDSILYIFGSGNIFKKIAQLIKQNKLEQKVLLKGLIAPEELDKITPEFYIGINLVEPNGLNQIYSLANRFFDYIQAGIPQVTMSFPEYKKINDEYKVAVLIDLINENKISAAINCLLNDGNIHALLKANCLEAKKNLVWENEEAKLIEFYKNIFA